MIQKVRDELQLQQKNALFGNLDLIDGCKESVDVFLHVELLLVGNVDQTAQRVVNDIQILVIHQHEKGFLIAERKKMLHNLLLLREIRDHSQPLHQHSLVLGIENEIASGGEQVQLKLAQLEVVVGYQTVFVIEDVGEEAENCQDERVSLHLLLRDEKAESLQDFLVVGEVVLQESLGVLLEGENVGENPD